MKTAEEAIVKTLTYSSIFHFPLTKEELWQFLISEEEIRREDFETALHKLSPKVIVSKFNFFCLTGQEESIQNRRKHSQEVQKKMLIAKRAAYYLSYIPTVKLIGISGGLAMGKAEETDDIDFFIITRKNTLFMTRLWVQMVLEMLYLRRKRQETVAKDKVCVNLLVDETQLTWPAAQHDVYTAHEIIHMKPLFEQDGVYEHFREGNLWVQQFFPNAKVIRGHLIGDAWKKHYITLRIISAILSVRPLEKLVGLLQKRHMKRFQTTEMVTDQVLAFHPVDYRIKTLTSLNTKLQQLGLLTNK